MWFNKKKREEESRTMYYIQKQYYVCIQLCSGATYDLPEDVYYSQKGNKSIKYKNVEYFTANIEKAKQFSKYIVAGVLDEETVLKREVEFGCTANNLGDAHYLDYKTWDYKHFRKEYEEGRIKYLGTKYGWNGWHGSKRRKREKEARDIDFNEFK